MRKTKSIESRRAIKRGMDFIYRMACDPQIFADYGSDLLACFYFISNTSQDPALRRLASRMGRERARQWRSNYAVLPPDADADTIVDLIYGSDSAERFKLTNKSLREQIRQAAGRFKAADFLYFDPRAEPPPLDVPHECACGWWNVRGRKRCSNCKKQLVMMTRYRVWYECLIIAYGIARYGITGTEPYSDLLKWLPTLRPYPKIDYEDEPDFYDAVYAASHIVYTLNNYSVYQLSPKWLPQEFEFLKASLKEAIAMDDPEMTGEILDSLRAFGLKQTHRLIDEGTDYLLSAQNADGSWGEIDDENIYGRYHSTWTAIDGLREYAWRGKGLSFPELKPLLRELQRNGS
ncbi:MAG: hypothetical protein JOZ52_07010 [Acidobacteria bacterium]|nr:hypothetical protein [Acidobacteriota bacterium]